MKYKVGDIIFLKLNSKIYRYEVIDYLEREYILQFLTYPDPVGDLDCWEKDQCERCTKKETKLERALL